MKSFPEIMSKWQWFILFNSGTILYLIISGTLKVDAISIVSTAIALLVINGIALISARKYKGKYKGW